MAAQNTNELNRDLRAGKL